MTIGYRWSHRSGPDESLDDAEGMGWRDLREEYRPRLPKPPVHDEGGLSAETGDEEEDQDQDKPALPPDDEPTPAGDVELDQNSHILDSGPLSVEAALAALDEALEMPQRLPGARQPAIDPAGRRTGRDEPRRGDVVPVAEGGGMALDNLTVLCAACHHAVH